MRGACRVARARRRIASSTCSAAAAGGEASDGHTVEVAAPSPGPRPQFSAVAPAAPAPDDGLVLRVRALEDEVAALRSGLDALRSELGIEPEDDEAQASG